MALLKDKYEDTKLISLKSVFKSNKNILADLKSIFRFSSTTLYKESDNDCTQFTF